ncbi:GNAT family N-acetyltransferase [Haloplasma contractile]|uniref:Acetyltransferase protein n=1 Tax=Haloplasma contractile SSD-17B TaxID=1033810 RepID=U2DZB8_9MOLU|nr:GNAT family N-acetyltransferase [Haloplasma contractile]ERJ13557.1 Putative acetyltransferase protein [Haloplasma contractile SSD-17B]
MSVEIKELTGDLFIETANMISKLAQYKKNKQDKRNDYFDQQSIRSLTKWCHEGTIYNIFHDQQLIGFCYVKFTQDLAYLEDVYIKKDFLKDGISKKAFKALDQILKNKNVESLLVYVSPKNTRMLHFYRECGFDHLNQLQLKKNYNDHLNKHDNIEILGFDFKR